MKIANIPDPNVLVPKVEGSGKEVEIVNALPDISLEDLITLPIKTILGFTMILTAVALVVAGFYYIQAKGNEEDIKKSKDILLYLVIGMVVIAAAYGVIAGIAQFEFF